MDEKQLMNEALNTRLIDYEDSFDKMIFENYFEEMVESTEMSRIKTDNYGDAGIDYIFFLFNRKLIFSLEDLEDIKSEGKNNRIDIYCIQIKNSDRLDSNVPNKFIEFSENLVDGKKPDHYNEEVKENIDIFTNLVKKFVLKSKFYIHFYYFNRAGKKQLESASDLLGRFDTLKHLYDTVDFIEEVDIEILGVNDIVKTLRTGKNFEYVFKDIDKFEAEVDHNDESTNAVIALIPITQFYKFICLENGQINDKLFESNIRDYKGRSNVNKNIIKTLQGGNNLDFWWLNNGITITVEDIQESKTAKRIQIINPQIVNGLQTSYSIYNYYSAHIEDLENEKRKLFVKILKVKEESEGEELEIIVATNSQNEIRDKDIHANDEVQKNIEQYFKKFGKYYQRKDKYYTNRRRDKKDIVKLSEMAKYINTIFLKDPSFTRNNPGKLLSGNKYNTIFQINNLDQDYERYYLAYRIYAVVMENNKGTIFIGEDEFERANFIHHLVYATVCLFFNTIDYSPANIKYMSIEKISKKIISEAMDVIVQTIQENEIPHAKILKAIKEQSFMQQLRDQLIKKINRNGIT